MLDFAGRSAVLREVGLSHGDVVLYVLLDVAEVWRESIPRQQTATAAACAKAFNIEDSVNSRTKRIFFAAVLSVLFMLQGYGRLSQSDWRSLLGWFSFAVIPVVIWVFALKSKAPPVPAKRPLGRLHTLIAGALGVFLVLAPLFWGPPSMGELVPAEGALVSYALYRTSGRNSDLLALFKIAGHAGRFWNDGVKNGNASILAGDIGDTVRVLYQPHASIAPIDGDAIKSYGLWINGQQIASAKSSLQRDRFLAYLFFPAMGFGLISFAYLQARRRASPNSDVSGAEGFIK